MRWTRFDGQEWLIFPLLPMIDDPNAFRFFMVAHPPVSYLIIWLLITES
ncbi:MAG: hypothetical protein ACOC47_08245 [Alkalispirochaetaceae bacterium]